MPCRWTVQGRRFSSSALTAADQAVALIMSTTPSRLNAFPDSEPEPVLCFDSAMDTESFAAKKSAIFLIRSEEDQTKNFIAGLMDPDSGPGTVAVADKKYSKNKF